MDKKFEDRTIATALTQIRIAIDNAVINHTKNEMDDLEENLLDAIALLEKLGFEHKKRPC